eukprot:4852361-Pleurochrysis_carterae.AAC.1
MTTHLIRLPLVANCKDRAMPLAWLVFASWELLIFGVDATLSVRTRCSVPFGNIEGSRSSTVLQFSMCSWMPACSDLPYLVLRSYHRRISQNFGTLGGNGLISNKAESNSMGGEEGQCDTVER